MIYKSFELHNVAEAAETPGGLRLYRFPRAVCDGMGDPGRLYGRYVAQTTTGCEIRFVTDLDRARISLTSLDEDGYVQIYRGDFRYYDGYVYSFPVRRGEATHITLLKTADFEKLSPALKRKEGGFSPDVWRIISDINFTMVMTDFEAFGGNVRPPRPDEEPEKTVLCYGTSLTYGACASAQSVCWAQLLGRLLGVNLLNKAMGGSCRSEKAVVGYFTSDAVKFDALVLENAVNMGTEYELYEQRTAYLLDEMTRLKPEVPIFMLTSYPNAGNVADGCACPVQKLDADSGTGSVNTDAIIRRLAARYSQVHLIEGAEIMNDFTALTKDLVHLSDYGHIMAATNLAAKMRGQF